VSAAVALAVAVLCVAGAGWQVPAGPSRATSTRGDALTGAARRAARAWHRHDFAALVAGSPGVMVRRRGADPSAPMPPAQAARTLRAFAGGAEEVQTEVGAVREVDEDRGYTEVQRTICGDGDERPPRPDPVPGMATRGWCASGGGGAHRAVRGPAARRGGRDSGFPAFPAWRLRQPVVVRMIKVCLELRLWSGS
jgi:hypothetical protein